MDSALYLDELINEYLLFRGFIKTYTQFNQEKDSGGAPGHSGAAAAEVSSASHSGRGGGTQDSGQSGGGGSGRGGGGISSSSRSSSSHPHISSPPSSSPPPNVPCDPASLVHLLLSQVRSLDIEALQHTWTLMERKFFVHLYAAEEQGQRQMGAAATAAALSPMGGSGAPSLTAATTTLGEGISASAPSTPPLRSSLRSLEQSLKKALLIRAVQQGRPDRLREAMERWAGEMTQSGHTGADIYPQPYLGDAGAASAAGSVMQAAGDTVSPASYALWGGNHQGGFGAPAFGGAAPTGSGWDGWFSLAYLPSPETHPLFAPYFSPRWLSSVSTALRNTLHTVFRHLPLPALLAFNVERERRRKNQAELRTLRLEGERMKAELQEATAQLQRLQERGIRIFQGGTSKGGGTNTPPVSSSAQAQPPTLSQLPPSTPASIPSATGSALPSPFSPASVLPVSAPAQVEEDEQEDTESWLDAPTSAALPPSPTALSPLSSPAPAPPQPTASGDSSASPSTPFAVSSAAVLSPADDVFEVRSTSVLLGHSDPLVKTRFNHEGSLLFTCANRMDTEQTDTSDKQPANKRATKDMQAETKIWNIQRWMGRRKREEELEEAYAANRAPAPLHLEAGDSESEEESEADPSEERSVLGTSIPSARASSSRRDRSVEVTPGHTPRDHPHFAPTPSHANSRARPTVRPAHRSSSSSSSRPALPVPSDLSTSSSYLVVDEPWSDEEDDGGHLRPLFTLSHTTPLSTLAVSKSDSYLLTGSASDGKVGVWSLGTAAGGGAWGGKPRLLTELSSRTALSPPSSLSSPCPVVLDLSCSPGDRFCVVSWATARHNEVGLLGSPELRGVVELIDLATGKNEMSFHAGSGTGAGMASASPRAHPSSVGMDECSQVNTLLLNHNGNMLVSGGADGLVRVYDTRSSHAIIGWSAHPLSEVAHIQLCADETSLLSVGTDGRGVEWSMHKMGRVLRRMDMQRGEDDTQRQAATAMQGHTRIRPEMALDGETKHLLLSGGWGGQAASPSSSALSYPSYLFTLSSSLPVQRLYGHVGPVVSVAWHPLSPLVATASQDHTARLQWIEKSRR